MKTVIEMAREVYGENTFWTGPQLERLERFADLIRADAIADEREACARVLEDRATHIENNHRRPHYGFPHELRQSIAAIRARSNT